MGPQMFVAQKMALINFPVGKFHFFATTTSGHGAQGGGGGRWGRGRAVLERVWEPKSLCIKKWPRFSQGEVGLPHIDPFGLEGGGER